MFKGKLSKYLLVGGMAAVGLVLGIAGMAGAQSATTTSTAGSTTVTSAATVDTPEPGDVADATSTSMTAHPHGHAPLGGDGIVSSVSGNTIVMGEESDEGGASYSIDASNAAITVNGAAGSLADVKVGEKIFVQGTTNGTNVTATSVSVGHPGGHKEVNEASEPAGSTDASDQ